jgi:hypothetical protein
MCDLAQRFYTEYIKPRAVLLPQADGQPKNSQHIGLDGKAHRRAVT